MSKSFTGNNKSSIFYTVKSFGDSNPFLNHSTSPNKWVTPAKIRRTSSQYHSQCISSSKLMDVRQTPKSIKEGNKMSPNTEIKDNVYGSDDISILTSSKEISSQECVIPHKIFSSKSTSPLSSVINKDIQPLVDSKKEIIKLTKSTLLSDIKNLFPEVCMDGIEEPELCGELTLTFTTSPPSSEHDDSPETKTINAQENEDFSTQENKTINTQENEKFKTPESRNSPSLHSPFIKFINKSSMKLSSILKEEESIFDLNYSLGTRLIQLCNQVYCRLKTIKSLEDIDDIIKVFVCMENLKELIQCWLLSSPRQTIQKFEDNYVKLYNNISKVIASFEKGETSESRKSGERFLSKLVCLIGKRLLEINVSLDDSLWHNIDEFVMDNLAKASTTQFHIALQSVINELIDSGREVSSLSYQSFMTKKAEALTSLLELSNEFSENLQLAMKKFALWYEHHNAETSLTQCYELQYLWHSENYHYLSSINSIIKTFTKCISKSVTEPGNISDIVQIDKSLQDIESELEKIQKSLPFSANEIEDDHFGLKELENSFKATLLVIGRIKHLISTSFSYGKSILKKTSITNYN